MGPGCGRGWGGGLGLAVEVVGRLVGAMALVEPEPPALERTEEMEGWPSALVRESILGLMRMGDVVIAMLGAVVVVVEAALIGRREEIGLLGRRGGLSVIGGQVSAGEDELCARPPCRQCLRCRVV